MSKKLIRFSCYKYKHERTAKTISTNGWTTLFLFYPDNKWDEMKRSLQDSLKEYPLTDYEWLHFNSESEKDYDETDEIFNSLRN